MQEEMPVPVTKKGKQKKTKVEEPVEEDGLYFS